MEILYCVVCTVASVIVLILRRTKKNITYFIGRKTVKILLMVPFSLLMWGRRCWLVVGLARWGVILSLDLCLRLPAQ